MDYLYYTVFILLFLLIVCVYYCIKFAIIIIKMQNSIEYSLDIIDQKYDSLSKILEIPIFYNSEEVKRAINDLEEARNSLLIIANELTKTSIQNIQQDDDIEYYDSKKEEK